MKIEDWGGLVSYRACMPSGASNGSRDWHYLSSATQKSCWRFSLLLFPAAAAVCAVIDRVFDNGSCR